MLRLYFCTLLCSLAVWSPFAVSAQTPVVSSPPAPLPEVQKLLDKGDQEGNAYHWQQALDAYQQALEKARSVKDKAGEAKTLRSIGAVYGRTGQLAKAMDYLQQALPIFQVVGDKSGEARTLQNIGNIYDTTGQAAKALNNYQQALALSNSIGDQVGKAKPLLGIGNVCSSTGEFVKALDAYQQALSVFRATGNRGAEAATLLNIGNVYYATGQAAKALDNYQQALALSNSIGDQMSAAGTLSNIGEVYTSQGESAKALDYYQQALFNERATGEKRGEAKTLQAIGAAYGEAGQFTKAMDYFQQALLLCRIVGDKRGEADVLGNIGLIYKDGNQPAKALDNYQQALALSNSIGDQMKSAGTLTNIGFAYVLQNHAPEAINALRQAVGLYEALRHDLGRLTEAKIAFTEKNQRAYRGYLDLLVRQERVAEAFALAQKTKARSLLELLENGRVNLTTRLTNEERKQLADLHERTTGLNREMIAEGVRNEAGAKHRVMALQEQLSQAERDLSAFTDTLYVRHPDVAQARGVHTLTVREAARMLPPDTALLEYATRQDVSHAAEKTSLVLFVVTPDGSVSVHTMPASEKQLQTLAAAFHRACANPDAEYQAQAKALYRLLLAPAEARLVGKKHLLICPDGPLWNVPFAALQDSKGRFVAETHSLTFAYSATGAAAALSKRARSHASGSVLAFANPDFGDATRFSDGLRLPEQRPVARPSEPVDHSGHSPGSVSRNLVSQLRGGGIKALPGTQAEADALHRLYPNAAIYTGVNAQEATFKRDAGQYRYVHLASHALFNDAAPLLSSVFLAAPPKSGAGSEEDGFLTARELFDLKLNAELVTLSACQTGQGESHSGEGIIGLTWALTVAGVPTQVVSQWSVDDGATADLMSGFYARLKAGQGKGAALQAAAQAIRADPQRRHPFYWAPFILMGDWR